MDEKTTPKTIFQTALHYALLLGVSTIIVEIIGMFIPLETRLENQNTIGIVMLLFYISSTAYFIAEAIKSQRKEQEGFITLGEGVALGSWIGLFSSAIKNTWTAIYFYLMAGLQEAERVQRISLERFNVPEEQIEQQMKIAKIFLQPYILLPMNIFFGFIFTVIVGLIVAAVMQKTKEHPF